ncbi:MAG: hypothetical protein ACI9LO_001730 [Planctomycetota bacterium]
MNIKTIMNRLLPAFLVSLTIMVSAAMPAQAAMVGTAQLQSGNTLQGIDGKSSVEKRGWIVEQLVVGGVAQDNAVQRVASLTDVQVGEIYQRIDEQPAGGNALVTVLLVLVLLDVFGVTDIFPFIRPVN